MPDTLGPTLLVGNLFEGAMRGRNTRLVTFTFSESLSTENVTIEDYQLTGPNGPVAPLNLQFRNDDRSIQLTYPELSVGSHQFLTHAAGVTDRAGNPFGDDDQVINFVVRDASIAWVNPLGGFWDDAANWDTGVVPSDIDDVLIDVVGTPTITVRSGTVQVRSLTARDALTLTGGTLSVERNFDLAATLTLDGARLSNSTIDVEAGGQITAKSGLLTGVTVNGDLDLSAGDARVRIEGGTTFTTAHLKGAGSRIGFAPGSVLSGTILFEGPNTGSRTVDTDGQSGTLTIGPTGVIRTTSDFAGSARIEPHFGSAGSMTLVNQGTISSQTSGRTLKVGPGQFTNSGTLEALNGGTLSVDGLTGNLNTVTLAGPSTVTLRNFTSSYVNNLGLSVATGQTLTLSGTWSSTGATNVNGGTLNLDGTFTTAGLNLPSFTRIGGTVNLTGTLNNADATLTLDAATGAWNLLRGTISGGTLELPDTTLLGITASTGNLKGVTVNGDLDLSADSAKVEIHEGTTFTTAHLKGRDSTIFFRPDSVLSGEVLFEGPDTGTRFVFVQGVSGAVTIGPSGVIRTTSDFAGSARTAWGTNSNQMTLVNQGTISSQTNGRTLTVGPGGFTNSGTLEALNGGTLSVNGLTGNLNTVTLAGPSTVTLQNFTSSYVNNLGLSVATGQTLTLNGTWSSTGAINVNGGTLNLGGTFTTAGLNLPSFTRSGGTVNLTGTLNNADATLTLDAATGAWNLLGGTISGGTLELPDSTILGITSDSTNRLTGVTVNGDLDLSAGDARVRIEGGTTFTTAHLKGADSAIGFAPDSVLSGTILFEGPNTSTRAVEMNGSSGTLTIGPTGVIRTTSDFAGSAQIGPGFRYGGSMTLVNQGTISSQTSGRTLTVSPTSFTNQGTLEALNGGTLSVSNLAAHAGTIRAGAGSVVSVTGAFTQTASGVLVTELRGTGAGQFGRITVSGAATLDGALSVTVGGGYSPANGDSFQVLTYASRTGTFATVNGNGLNYSPTYNATDLTIVRVAPLLAEGAALSPPAMEVLSSEALAAIVTAGIRRLAAVGLSAEQLLRLQATQFVITDLDSVQQLGNSRPGVIEIDDNGVGFGWFVDLTPDDDDEYLMADGTNSLQAVAGGAADGKVDLFTVVLHELGHVLGLDHSDDLLFESLAAGQRKQISAQDVDQLFNLLGQ